MIADISERRSLKKMLAAWKQRVSGTTLPPPPDYHGRDVWLSRLVEHTDQVVAGACFVARVRPTGDGHPYIPAAIERGAALIVGQRDRSDLPFSLPASVPYLRVADTGLIMAWLAAAWEDFPGWEMVMVGVTGTDGKTTTCNILTELMRQAGVHAGLLSTLRALVGEKEELLALHVTTPEAPIVQGYLRRMVEAGMTHCILEATSHGLAQHRVGAIPFDVAVVTNITHEHLDYHGGYEEYFGAKAQLFEKLFWPQTKDQRPLKRSQPRTAILNKDDDSYKRLGAMDFPAQIDYGLGAGTTVSANSIRYAADETFFTLQLPQESIPIRSPLVGEFNVYNMLAASAAAVALGATTEAIRLGLARAEPLTGRMQRVDEGQPFLTIVDFAHTPNSLKNAIEAARGMAPAGGRVIVVFGSAGERDVEKRRMMAEIAARDANLTVLTAEDPRSEPLAAILETMAAGCARLGGIEGETFWRVPDRGQAIFRALEMAEEGDVVLICGKGHEQSMAFGKTEYPWDDVEATRIALLAIGAGRPMPDLGLPTYGTG